jgi:galactose mutarotase-like enzyme
MAVKLPGESSIFRAVLDSFDLVGLRNNCIEIAIVPQLGGKILTLKNRRSGREWMWRPEGGMLFANRPGDSFEISTMSGADDCLPTVAACEFSGRRIPDHGEVWSRPCEVERSQPNVLHTWLDLSSMPARFERVILLHDHTVRIDYRLRNLSDDPHAFLWAFHPLMKIEPGDELLVPVNDVSVEVTTLPKGRRGDRWTWPIPMAGVNFQQLDLGPSPGYAKMFATSLASGRAAVFNPITGDRLTYCFDAAELPALGIWITRGGWSAHHHFALEPTHVPFDSLADAADAKACPILKPRGVSTWHIELEFNCED